MLWGNQIIYLLEIWIRAEDVSQRLCLLGSEVETVEDAAVCVCHHSVVVHEAMLTMVTTNAEKFETDFLLRTDERSMKGALGRQRKGKRKRDMEFEVHSSCKYYLDRTTTKRSSRH